MSFVLGFVAGVLIMAVVAILILRRLAKEIDEILLHYWSKF